jgi:hypothetical protein
MPNELKLPAVEVRQSPGRKLYSFAVDGKLVHRFATISRVNRTDDGGLHGYQRPEVLSHIEEIRNYLESPSPMVPNAIVLGLRGRSAAHVERAAEHLQGHRAARQPPHRPIQEPGVEPDGDGEDRQDRTGGTQPPGQVSAVLWKG